MSETTQEKANSNRASATQAASKARQRLVQAHREEYYRILNEERSTAGLSAIEDPEVKIRSQIAAAEERLNALRSKINS